MIVKSGFFSSFQGDRPYTADDFNTLFGDIIAPGVMPMKEVEWGELMAPFELGWREMTTDGYLLQVTVGPGRAFFENVWINCSTKSEDLYIKESEVPAGEAHSYITALHIDKENKRTELVLLDINARNFSGPDGVGGENLNWLHDTIEEDMQFAPEGYYPLNWLLVGIYSESVLWIQGANLAGTEWCPYAKSNLESNNVVEIPDFEIDSPVPLKFGGTGINQTPLYETQKNGWVSFPLNAIDWDKVTDYPYSVFIAPDEVYYNSKSGMSLEEFKERCENIPGKTGGSLISIPVSGDYDRYLSSRINQFFIPDKTSTIGRYIYRRARTYDDVWTDWVKISDLNAPIPTSEEPLPKSAGGTGHSLPDDNHVETALIQYPLNAKNPDILPYVSYTATVAKGLAVDTSNSMYDLTAEALANLTFPSTSDTIWNVITVVNSGRSVALGITNRYIRAAQFWWAMNSSKLYLRVIAGAEEGTTTNPWGPFVECFDTLKPQPGFKKVFSSRFSVSTDVLREDESGMEDWVADTTSGGVLTVYDNALEKYLWIDIDATNVNNWTLGYQKNAGLIIENDEGLKTCLLSYFGSDVDENFPFGLTIAYDGGPDNWELDASLSLRLWLNGERNVAIFMIYGHNTNSRSDETVTYPNRPAFRSVFQPIFYGEGGQ